MEYFPNDLWNPENYVSMLVQVFDHEKSYRLI